MKQEEPLDSAKPHEVVTAPGASGPVITEGLAQAGLSQVKHSPLSILSPHSSVNIS